MMPSKRSILLIDDQRDLLDTLRQALAPRLPNDVEIRTWVPESADADPLQRWNTLIDDGTVLVVADYDLTKQGLTGFFGATVVSWCQARAIPVGDFSRDLKNLMAASRPNLFEMKVPPNTNAAAEFIATAFDGFVKVQNSVAEIFGRDPNLRSPAAILARVLGRPSIEPDLALYMSRLGEANPALIDRLGDASATDTDTSVAGKDRLISYIVGHVLLNGVLRYPGPILSMDGLAAYCGTTRAEADGLAGLFADARYDGPFAGAEGYYWTEDVHTRLDRDASVVGNRTFETSGEFNRAIVGALLDHELATFSCSRCDGVRGGYFCPFTLRPVCELPDCSVAANSWIPAGASACRIEREYFDEWAPILGL
jgi:hypothetical protein